MKKLLKHLKLLIIAIVVGLFFIISHNNNRILIRNEIIESEKFDENIDDYTVIFFSDLHYGSFIKQNFLNKLGNPTSPWEFAARLGFIKIENDLSARIDSVMNNNIYF